MERDGGGGGGRERETETERQRENERQTDRQTETEKQRGGKSGDVRSLLHSQCQTPLHCSGSTFVRWGRTTCPNNASLVYSGELSARNHWFLVIFQFVVGSDRNAC